VNKILCPLSFTIPEGHLANQVLWFAGGLVCIIIFSFIIFQLLWKSFKLEAVKSSKMSIIIALLLVFIWFTILFNTFISIHLIIIIAIIVIGILFVTVIKLEES
jgi:hypothetical protein